MKRTAVIRPVYLNDVLTGYALCKGETILVDSHILDHFGKDYNGKMIKETAKEFHGIDECRWGKPINN